ncbi:WD repeat-containing protein 5 [Venturia nashicola]|nr:WD repeat-containing protein 5 [Venturia nashicola]
MQFQTLLPAILFAQSSFAYFCCFEYWDSVHAFQYHRYFGGNAVVPWTPFEGCTVTVNTYGSDCSKWTHIVTPGCRADTPRLHIGVAPNNKCTSPGKM